MFNKRSFRSSFIVKVMPPKDLIYVMRISETVKKNFCNDSEITFIRDSYDMLHPIGWLVRAGKAQYGLGERKPSRGNCLAITL